VPARRPVVAAQQVRVQAPVRVRRPVPVPVLVLVLAQAPLGRVPSRPARWGRLVRGLRLGERQRAGCLAVC